MLARETNLQASKILFDEWIEKSATALDQVTRHFGERLTGDLEGLRQEVRQAGGLLQGTAAGLRQTGGQVSQALTDLQAIARRLEQARNRITPPPIPRIRTEPTGLVGRLRRWFGRN
jgi:paraquat-inducible protein B